MANESVRLVYSVPELAMLFGISKNLAYLLARQGKLPGLIRLGRRYVCSKLVVQKLLEGKGDHGEADAGKPG